MGLKGLRIGVLGGTFDPIHYGHLVAAEEARHGLSLKEVLFVPAAQPPHKQRLVLSPPADRLAMVSLAIASNPHFQLSYVDWERPGPHYSVDTVRLLQEELGTETEICFLVGLDSLVELPTWHEPQRLIEMCRVVVLTRPGYETFDVASLEPWLPGASRRIQILAIPGMSISSSDLRQRVATGRPIKYQVPPEVEEYIYAHNLYR
ncbi:MAG: nicotinate-nucleotide adenylyltransferase [Chloroflexi bacterium]|nr:nicotinate-nucleotide adenylyltransferase [Chloroflexota bacterium]